MKISIALKTERLLLRTTYKKGSSKGARWSKSSRRWKLREKGNGAGSQLSQSATEKIESAGGKAEDQDAIYPKECLKIPD